MGKAKDITGQRFGRLVAIKRVENSKPCKGHPKGDPQWLFQCDCGNTKVILTAAVVSKFHTQSCGCIHQESSRNVMIKYQKKLGNREDLTGRVFGRWTVLSKAENTPPSNSNRKGRPQWLCKCECGTIKPVLAQALRSRQSVSCGCYQREVVSGLMLKSGYFTNERRHTLQSRMWDGARLRAKKGGYAFSIVPEDIIIPEFCPLLGIPLASGMGEILKNKSCQDNSPTLDKIIPKKGYIKGNVIVISYKANRLKSNASVEELLLLSRNLKNIIEDKATEENKLLSYCI